jgi:tetratricopeptide (TPR) repeat protein
MWETATGQRRSTFTGHSKPVTSVAVSPTNDSIASRSADGTIRIWLSATEAEVKQHTDEVLVRADHLFTRGEWHEARSLLDEAIQNSPSNGRLFTKRGDLHRLQRNWRAALEDYNNAIARLGPNDVFPYKERAEMHVRLGQRFLAVNDFVKAIGISPLLTSEQSLNQIRNTFAKKFVTEAYVWSYTTTEPPAGWEQTSFDDRDWPKGRAPFGLDTSYLDMSLDRKSNTNWMSKDIWLRCTFTAEEEDIDNPLILNAYINDHAEVFINGVLAAQKGAHLPAPWLEGPIEVDDNVNLKAGKNVLAVHCQNRSTFGYGKIDLGLYLRAVKDSAFMDVLKGALEQSPDRPGLNTYLADQHAHRQQWNETGECIDRLIASSPIKSEDWLKAAALSVYNRDLERYHQLCGLMLGRFVETSNSQDAEMIAKACLLAPPLEANLPAIREMIVKVQRSRLGRWFVPFAQLATALAELRSGNNQKANDSADKSLAETSGGVPPNWEWAQPIYQLALAVKALAHARLGERELAIKEATEFKQFVQEQSPLHTSVPIYTNWNNWLTCEILLREITLEMPEIKN